MKKKKILLSLICLLFSMHCSNQKQPPLEEVVLEENSKFIDLQWVKEKNTDISDVNFAYFYLGRGTVNVYGYSTKQTKCQVLKIYDQDLNLNSEKFFNMGEGPGDLGGAAIFSINGDYTYIADHQQRRVNIFDKELKFIKFIKTPGAFFSPEFINEGKFFISTKYDEMKRGTNTININLISFPDFETKKLITLGPINRFDKNKKLIIGAIPQVHYFHKEGKIYFINMETYQIMMFDLSGKQLKRIKVEVEKIPVPNDLRMAWLEEQIESRILDRFTLVDFVQPASWMIPLNKGFVVIRRSSYSTKCTGLVDADYFDYDLHLLGKVKFPCFYPIYQFSNVYFPRSFAYNDGYVYLITKDLKETDEDINLEKWKLVE